MMCCDTLVVSSYLFSMQNFSYHYYISLPLQSEFHSLVLGVYVLVASYFYSTLAPGLTSICVKISFIDSKALVCLVGSELG